jgi:DNA-binding transcriptional regulator PaaX
MHFLKRYPVSLLELLVSPVINRAILAPFKDLPHVTADLMSDVASRGGFNPGAIRTALSRLRTSGTLESSPDEGGVMRYRMSAIHRSVNGTVQSRFSRPGGFLLAVFSFSTEDARERQVIREVLKAHGFKKLAQNVYINGQIDTGEIERVVQEKGLAEHLYLFRCSDIEDPRLESKLTALFDVTGRWATLSHFEHHLQEYLEDQRLRGDDFAWRFFAAGPIHYRITFVDEPPLPARCLPAGYPLDRLMSYLPELAQRRSHELVDYYRRVNG